MGCVKRWGTVWDDDDRRVRCVCLVTGSAAEKRSPVKRERSGSRDSASSGRSSKASGKSRRESLPLGGLEVSDVDGESLDLPWNWEGEDLEEPGFLGGAWAGRRWAGRGSVAPWLLARTLWPVPSEGPLWVVAEGPPSGSRFG